MIKQTFNLGHLPYTCHMCHYSMYWPIKKTPFSQNPNLLMHKKIVPLIVVTKSSASSENDQTISELCPFLCSPVKNRLHSVVRLILGKSFP